MVSACRRGSSSAAIRCSVPRLTQVMISEGSRVRARSMADAWPPVVRADGQPRAPGVLRLDGEEMAGRLDRVGRGRPGESLSSQACGEQ